MRVCIGVAHTHPPTHTPTHPHPHPHTHTPTHTHTHIHTHPHTDPMILPKVQVDKGAIKFILSGANIMCPGLTSPGARMDVSLPEDTVVVSFNPALLVEEFVDQC